MGSHGTHIRDFVNLNPAVYIPGSTLSTDRRRPFAGYSDITMVSILWEHGPQMLDMMNQRKIEWPRFTAPEMADLIAYLNSM